MMLSRDNLSDLTPHPLYSRFYYSHPALSERLKALDFASAQTPDPDPEP